MSEKKSARVPTPADPLAPIMAELQALRAAVEFHLSGTHAAVEVHLSAIHVSLLTRLEPAAIAMTAAAINGSKPFPTDPQEQAALILRAREIMDEARKYEDTERAIGKIVTAESDKLAERGIDVRALNDLASHAASCMPEPMKFAAFVNRIVGNDHTGENMARVRKWLAWRYPEADIEAEMKKLRGAASSYLAERAADSFAVSFKKWHAVTLADRNRKRALARSGKKPVKQKKQKKALASRKRTKNE